MVSCGYSFKDKIIGTRTILVSGIGYILTFVGIMSDLPQNMHTLLYLLIGFFGGPLIINITWMVDNKIKKGFKVLMFCGKNSLYFYVLHFVGIFILENSMYRLVGYFLCILPPIVYIFAVRKYKWLDFPFGRI